MHTNAAYSRLTGLDSHLVVGKGIATLLSVPAQESEPSPQDEQESVQQDGNPSNANDLVAAAAAGRARAQGSKPNTPDVSLSRVIVSCGNGHVNPVLVASKPHQMVGRNVSIVKEAGNTSPAAGTRDEGASNGTSLTSHDDGRFLSCRMSIAPVTAASSSNSYMDIAAVTDKDGDMQQGKRQKHDCLSQDAGHRGQEGREVSVHHRRHLHRPRVTHYVIQVQLQDGKPGKHESLDSLSSNSTSVEARLHGLSKAELEAQRLAVQVPLAHEEPQVRAGEEEESIEANGQVAATAIG